MTLAHALLALQIAAASPAPAAANTFNAVLAGKRCSEVWQQINCEYAVGHSLRFELAGVGMPDTAVTFYKVDRDGDYYASYGLLHGCLIIKPGAKRGAQAIADFAFVSPLNGKVYRTWRECQDRR